MKSLFRFFYKYHLSLLFLVLETFCFILIVQYNLFQKASFINSSNLVFAKIYDSYNSVNSYFLLYEQNNSLIQENTKLHNLLKKNYKANIIKAKEIADSVYSFNYKYYPAIVINNSTNKLYNFITLDKGSRHGIKADMAVVSPDGVIGIVKNISGNYCTVISLLNLNLKISAKIKRKNHIGSISWNGDSYQKCDFNEIPFHVDVEINDTIVTSGYSSIFPEGIPIGTIIYFNKNQSSSFYDIKVKLFTDFTRLSHVYIVDNKFQQEIKKLEESNTSND
ncbi:MAG: rod shape-determining protein MreC [Bacteroidota bacterium]